MVGRVKKSQREELLVRSISALVIIPPVVGVIFLGSPYFELLVIIGGLILTWECYKLCNKQPAWVLLGTVYIIVSSFALFELRSIHTLGLETVLSLFVIVWTSDSGAFAVGRMVGGKKLAPKISPNKTWSGLIGGILCATFVGIFIAFILKKNNVGSIALISGLIGASSQAGDLMESWLKRIFGKKDTGKLIPGHGGLFDRVDGLLFTATVVWVVSFSFTEKSFLLWM